MAIPTIQGNLPFQSLAGAAGAMQGLGAPPAQAAASLGPAYAGAYKSALDFNTANYANILGGYQSTLSGQQDALSSIGKGYSDLSSQVLGDLQGAGAAERQRISDAYQNYSGQASQSLVDRGLGNSTVVDSTQRGLFADQQKQYVDLANQLAQQRAGYQSNLGLAGLAQQQQAALANTGLAQNQLGFMERVNSPYPDAGMYAQLAQQYGMRTQADQDRQAALGAAGTAGRVTPQSSGSVSRGGGGFFTSPTDAAGGGSYQPQSFAPAQRPTAPPLGAVGSQAAGDAASAYFNNLYTGGFYDAGGGGQTPTGAGALGGAAAAAGFGSQFAPPLAYPGEGDPGAGPANPWAGGQYGYGSYGGGSGPPAPAPTPDTYGYF